jgi:hypothetical protein
VNIDTLITRAAGIVGIAAGLLVIYSHLLDAQAPPQIRAAVDGFMKNALPWLKGLAAAFIGGAIVTTYNAVSDPATYNWSTGLPKLWHSAWTSGLVASFFYFMHSPFVKQFMPSAPVPATAPPAPVDTPPLP